MQVPNLYAYTSTREFLRDFLRVNKAAKATFSRRSLARDLKWPLSLVDQLIAGKKRLSIRRCLEFSKALKLDKFASERLLLLSLKDDPSEIVSTFAKERLSEGQRAFDSPRGPRLEVPPKLGFYVLLAYEVAKYHQRPLTWRDLTRQLPWLTSFDAAQYRKAVGLLKRQGFIKVTTTRNGSRLYRVLQGAINMSAARGAAGAEWGEFLARSCHMTMSRFAYSQKYSCASHGFSIVPAERFEEVKNWIFQMRDWLESFDHPDRHSGKGGDKVLFHFGFNIMAMDGLPL